MENEHKEHHFHGHWRARPFQRGDFKYILLQQLKEKPSYGYEIIRALEERFHGFYIPSPGSVYPTLQMLEEMGYVSSGDNEGKRNYRITAEGLKLLDDEKESAERIDNQFKNWCNPENIDELGKAMHELEKLARLFRGKARTADTGKLNRMREALLRAYNEILEE